MAYDADGYAWYRKVRAKLGNPIPNSPKKKSKPRVDNRKGDRHRPGYKRPPKPKVERFRQLHFIAWDGEGITDEGEFRNRYVMLSNSKRQCIRGENLGSQQIFEFLLEHREDKRAIHCVYGAVYDFTHWILDLPEELKRALHDTGECIWRPVAPGYKRKRKTYLVQFTPRKHFSVEDRTDWTKQPVYQRDHHDPEWESRRDWFIRNKQAARKLEKEWRNSNRKRTRKIDVWDVIGFFQTSFVKTLKKWKVGTPEQVDFVAQMKEQRSDFTSDGENKILEYNFLECELLQALMEQLHALLVTNPLEPEDSNVWLPLKRWDGAGAVAVAILKREGVQPHRGSSTELIYGKKAADWHYRDKREQHEIEIALRSAYYGGRIECIRRGRARAPGYDIDVRSAYPAAMTTLPSFAAGGRWHRCDSFDPALFGVWKIEWTCEREGHPIFPLPYRMHTGSVIFPPEGAGWYHTSEVEAAMSDTRNHIRVLAGWIWTPATDVKPFAFLERYFNARLHLQAIGHAAEKIIKLGTNSVYGKMAQTIGSMLEDVEYPVEQYPFEIPDQTRSKDYVHDCGLDKIFSKTKGFFNLAWAGAVTAHCRATMYRHAMPYESEIVMILTDGLFGTGETPDLPQENKLGGLEITEYDDSIAVQAGVYFLAMRKDDGTLDWGKTKRTRGFNSDDVDHEQVLDAWEKADTLELTYPSRPRFQTLGYAIGKRDFSELACWKSQPRNLNLYFDSKRTSIKSLLRPRDFDPKKAKELRLHLNQLPTWNFRNADFNAGCPSRPHNPKWKEQLHDAGEDLDFALTEGEIEGDDYVDNFTEEIKAIFGFDTD